MRQDSPGVFSLSIDELASIVREHIHGRYENVRGVAIESGVKRLMYIDYDTNENYASVSTAQATHLRTGAKG